MLATTAMILISKDYAHHRESDGHKDELFLQRDIFVPDDSAQLFEPLVEDYLVSAVDAVPKSTVNLLGEVLRTWDSVKRKLKRGDVPRAFKTATSTLTTQLAALKSELSNDLDRDQTAVTTLLSRMVEVNQRFEKRVVPAFLRETHHIREAVFEQNRLAGSFRLESESFEFMANKYIRKSGLKNKACCEMRKAGILKVEYLSPSVSCDLTHSNYTKCSEKAEQAAIDRLTDPFTSGLQLFQKLHTECNSYELALRDSLEPLRLTQQACNATATVVLSNKLTITQQASLKQALRNLKFMRDEYSPDYASMSETYRSTVDRARASHKRREAMWARASLPGAWLHLLRILGEPYKVNMIQCKKMRVCQYKHDWEWCRELETKPLPPPVELTEKKFLLDTVQVSKILGKCDLSSSLVPSETCVVPAPKPPRECTFVR